MKQTWLQSHAETLAQNVIGIIVGFIVLACFGLSPIESIQLQVVLFFTSYVRSYLIRRHFNKKQGVTNGL